MNLYNLHSDPKSLDHHDEAHESVPKLTWKRYQGDDEEMMKREHIWAKDPWCSYTYADEVINGPFKLGEVVIAKDAQYSYNYAKDILNGPFKLGEAAIAKHGFYSYLYARNILKGPFKLGEPEIAKDHLTSPVYAKHILHLPTTDEQYDWGK